MTESEILGCGGNSGDGADVTTTVSKWDNGQWAQKVRVASKTLVTKHVRSWVVKH